MIVPSIADPSEKFSLFAPNFSLLREKYSLFHCVGILLQAIEFASRLAARIAKKGPKLKNYRHRASLVKTEHQTIN
jgi:hypothetical protein